MKRFTVRDPVIKSVKPKDRIKYWNVVPGDQIRLLGDSSNRLHEVLSINKISNRVFVKGAVSGVQQKLVSNKNYHYSRCQLFLGNYELPKPGSTEPRLTPVFAKRLGTTSPFWNPFLRRFEWQRFATSTYPRLPDSVGEKLPIAWPQPARANIPDPSSYDALHDVVAKVTYQLPKIDPRPGARLPDVSEDAFLASVVNPHLRDSLDESAPVEPFLHKELSNPHSKAKKLRRFKEYKLHTKELLKQILVQEMKRSDNPKEARTIAMFRWRAQLKAEREEKKKMRWKHKAEVANLERKAARKVRKEQQQRRLLTELSLKEAPNQFIPKDV
ncbi:hypothetical protein Agabi119p4_4700 [Agaricus bisporus var. burnettii]|uniref:Uncharacterized protein n=1 Tax=Agaricus bisporus var. burnettii TaxID=192524 RepID=A0A8H7F3X2_AGABI|nr:hypothetical protein Agabi119p4_4700 [Agaricus bisporus var. burnettii]